MPKFAPKVIDGTRGPKADRLEDMRAQSEQEHDALAGHVARGKVEGTVYLSMYPGYIVQLSAPADITDPFTGKKKIGRPVRAVFSDGRYVNNARDLELRKFIDTELQSKTMFGLPGSGAHYWLADAAMKMAQAAAKANAGATLRKLREQNPAEFEEFVAELKQGDATDAVMPAAPSA